MTKPKKTDKAKTTKKTQKRTKKKATPKQPEKKVDEQKALDAEDRKLRDELDIPQCPHCGHDKRTEKEVKTGQCSKCHKQGTLGEASDIERPDIGAAAHNRRAYERSRLSEEETLLSICELDAKGVPKKDKKNGRPAYDWRKIVRYLEEAFRLDATVEEACSYARVSTTWYHDEKKKNPEFSEKITMAKQYPLLVAKGAVVGAMEAGDQITGLKYLERRQKKLYSPRVEVTGEEGDAIQIDIKAEAAKRAGKFKKPKTSPSKNEKPST